MTWVCDTCGEAIRSVDDGWLEWKTRFNDAATRSEKSGFRLVHGPGGPRNNRCMYNEERFRDGEVVGDLQLETFTGPDGLMTLLEFLSDNPQSADEIIEIIKRIHIPGYDTARHHFAAAIRAGVFEPNTKPGFHSVSDIDATNAWATQRRE